MRQNNIMITFLYGTKAGRVLLKLVQQVGIDNLIVKFLWSPYSRFLVGWYARRHNISMEEYHDKKFNSFRDFFIRPRKNKIIDLEPSHLISPCDGWMSAFTVHENSCFSIKDSHYRLSDLLEDYDLGKTYHGGDCLIFRLAASDYHHYCYIDDGYHGKNHFIQGKLHSVQPIACEKYPVYTLNRRVWTLLTTEHFGPVVQIEIGALIVGGIFNKYENCRFRKGKEMGHFELAGSTIVLLFQKNRIRVSQHILEHLSAGREFRVTQGMWIGDEK